MAKNVKPTQSRVNFQSPISCLYQTLAFLLKFCQILRTPRFKNVCGGLLLLMPAVKKMQKHSLSLLMKVLQSRNAVLALYKRIETRQVKKKTTKDN